MSREAEDFSRVPGQHASVAPEHDLVDLLEPLPHLGPQGRPQVVEER